MNADSDDEVCQQCNKAGDTVAERGRMRLMAILCEPCWNQLANALAEQEGATAPPRVEPDPDDNGWYEPPDCPECGMPVRRYPTNYDRWVYLSTVEMPAKDVPSRYRWRLGTIRTQRSPVIIDLIAVRIGGIDPLPNEPVIPAHRAVCTSPDAVWEAQEARTYDLIRDARRNESAEGT